MQGTHLAGLPGGKVFQSYPDLRSDAVPLANQLVLGGRLSQEGCDLPQVRLCFSAKAIP